MQELVPQEAFGRVASLDPLISIHVLKKSSSPAIRRVLLLWVYRMQDLAFHSDPPIICAQRHAHSP
ncbi:hypothetical protein D3C76_269770 [compost metagenome]